MTFKKKKTIPFYLLPLFGLILVFQSAAVTPKRNSVISKNSGSPLISKLGLKCQHCQATHFMAFYTHGWARQEQTFPCPDFVINLFSTCYITIWGFQLVGLRIISNSPWILKKELLEMGPYELIASSCTYVETKQTKYISDIDIIYVRLSLHITLTKSNYVLQFNQLVSHVVPGCFKDCSFFIILCAFPCFIFAHVNGFILLIFFDTNTVPFHFPPLLVYSNYSSNSTIMKAMEKQLFFYL